MKQFLSILIALSWLVFPTLAHTALKARPSMLRLTFEEIDLPGNETMGLLGSSYLVHLNRNIYAGLGIYSAVTGQRGGFFTGGLEAGALKKMGRKWTLDTGLFIGGGGGGAAPQGGGLMIRPHIGLMYKTDIGRFGLQYSYIDFPNGDISSQQIALSYDRPLSLLISGRWLEDNRLNSLGKRFIHKNKPANQDFSLLLQSYNLPDNTLNTSGNRQDEAMSLIGIEWDYFFGDRTFFRLQPLGALGGGSDGYASLLMGLGYRYPFNRQTSIKFAGTLGASGGGEVETGGGFTTDAALTLQHRFNNGLLLGLRAGLVSAPDGDFKASSVGLLIGHSDQAPAKKSFSASDLKTRHWRLRATHQTYMPTGDTRRKGGTTQDDRDVHLFGLQTDIFLNKHVYLTGQAIGAYDGDAGGYAAGLVGPGFMTPLWNNSRLLFNAEMLVGAAGGGGLAVGDGLITQAMIGLAYRTSRSTSLQLDYGKIKSNNGTFEADVLNLTFGIRFSTLTWR
jgi:hypothetical protein